VRVLRRSLDLTNCRGIDAAALCSTLPALHHLSSITLDGIPEAS
jgi:hypothetical protein